MIWFIGVIMIVVGTFATDHLIILKEFKKEGFEIPKDESKINILEIIFFLFGIPVISFLWLIFRDFRKFSIDLLENRVRNCRRMDLAEIQRLRNFVINLQKKY